MGDPPGPVNPGGAADPAGMEVTILIPMAGQGSRFSDVGFLQPKPVIDVGGEPMIKWVLDNILPRSFDLRARIVVVVRRDQDQLARVAAQLRQTVPNLEVVYADALTDGAACTCLLAREHIHNTRPLLIINSDQYIDWNDAGDSSPFWRQVALEAAQGYDANILCFKRPMELGDTKWSYAATDADGFVNDVREKEVISDNATVGAYYWQRGADFVSAAEEMIARDIRVKGEFYVAPAYNINLERGQRVRLSFCRRLWGLGVPADLTDFASNYLRPRNMAHLASLLGCSLQDLSHLSPLLPGGRPARAARDDSMRQGCSEPPPAPTGPHAAALSAPLLPPPVSAQGSSGGGAEDGRRGGEETLLLLEAMRNMQRVKFIACENEPRAIEAAIADGFDVKVCVQYVDAGGTAAAYADELVQDHAAGRYYLGGDGAMHEVELGLLQKHAASLWIECQDTATLCHFAGIPQLQSFAKTNDQVVLTSHKKLWARLQHAGTVQEGEATVVELPPGADAVALLGQALVAICCQDVRGLEEKRRVVLRAAQVATCSPVLSPDITGHSYRRIKLIVFDLDGVLVESQQLHYQALNQALSAVAGPDFCISQEEHETVYDGLSTQQKLQLLTRSKGLPLQQHDAIWQKKQELTQLLVKETVPRDRDIEAALADIKRAGFPVAVASNCIRESVLALLSAVGIQHLIDAIYCNEDVTTPKPDGEIYELVARSFGNLPPHQVAVFEDSTRGFEAVVRAQCNLFKVKSPRDIRANEVLGRVLAFEACSIMEELVNVVVPMAGAHPTFCMEGPDRQNVEVPVVFSSVRGKPALFWTIHSLQPLPKRVHFIFVVRRSLGKSSLCSLSRILPWSVDYNSMSIVVLDKPTRGAAQSVLAARHLIDNQSPLAIFDGNHRLAWPSTSNGLAGVFASMLSEHSDAKVPRARQGQQNGGSGAQDGVPCAPRALVTVIRDHDPRWSYVQFAPGSLSHVVNVKEKMQVSDMACSGLYCFRRGVDFVQAALATHSRLHHSVEQRTKYYLASVVDSVIGMGGRVEAVVLCGSSSVRQFGELKAFGDAVFAQVGRSEQMHIYHDMRARNARRIAADGLSHDAALTDDWDPRRCLAAYVMASSSNFIPSPKLEHTLQQLSSLMPSHVVYQALSSSRPGAWHKLRGSLHWTLMQLVGFNMFDKTTLPADYTDLLQTVIQQHLTPFEIHFDALILTPSNLVLVGHPTIDVNGVRDCVRASLNDLGYPLLEPYKADLLHMTLVRFSQPLAPDLLAALEHLVASSNADDAFNGLLRVDHVDVSAASWKMQPEELAGHEVTRIPLFLPL